MVLDGKFVEYVTFGYQENGTPTANDDTLLVFFTPESAGVCKIIEIPNIGAYYQEISASWNIMRLSLRIDTGNGALYEVTSDGYRVIE
ncbi:MAG: hypothetical protein H6766_04095 [Candidatus Peribacteria bacterium]|nr:MAG: hypothetical protein H6766_04095 [Candidatus Peribacteria bacterium]